MPDNRARIPPRRRTDQASHHKKAAFMSKTNGKYLIDTLTEMAVLHRKTILNKITLSLTSSIIFLKINDGSPITNSFNFLRL